MYINQLFSSENLTLHLQKVNIKNAWNITILDHLTDILRAQVDQGNGNQNFQLASSTLNAGVQVYGTRVDSVYADTYKILGGLNTTTKVVNGLCFLSSLTISLIEELQQLAEKSTRSTKKVCKF